MFQIYINYIINLEKEMATHCSILAWEIPWTDERAWWATVYGVAKNRTRMSARAHTHTHTHTPHTHIQIHVSS